MEKIYNKLVRDKIPDIIRERGAAPITRILDTDEFSEALNKKLVEEVKEFLDGYDVEELVDIYEVLLAILHIHNISIEDFKEICNRKAEERGTFENRIFLISVDEK